MTYGFREEDMNGVEGRESETFNMCLILGSIIPELIQSNPEGEILWGHPSNQAVLVEKIGEYLVKDQGYISNGGSITKY